MDFRKLVIRIIFFSQINIGILGNFSLIFYYLVLYYREHALKPTELILMHLMAANALLILSAGVPQTMAVWGLKHFLDGFGCKLLLYIHGFSRSVSICTICFLSVFQAMTISLRKSCSKDHKVKDAKYIGSFISLLWVFYMLTNLILFVYPFIKINNANVTRKRDFGYCYMEEWDEISDSLYAAFVMCPEVLVSGLIAWSSGSMIVFLHRHKQRIQHIRSSHNSCRNSPESRATRNILVLVCTFFAFYTISTILRGCVTLFYNQSWWLMNITSLTSLCFPCFGPFVLMSHYSIVSRLSLAPLRKKR